MNVYIIESRVKKDSGPWSKWEPVSMCASKSYAFVGMLTLKEQAKQEVNEKEFRLTRYRRSDVYSPEA
jgi:hypothetical protein